MNDEIKELMTNIIYNEDVNGFICTDERYKEIKNYITNLQQENDYYFKKNNELSGLNTSLRSDKDNYKSRIDKAIEYIEENDFTNDMNFMENGIGNLFQVILNFLRGDSNE